MAVRYVLKTKLKCPSCSYPLEQKDDSLNLECQSCPAIWRILRVGLNDPIFGKMKTRGC